MTDSARQILQAFDELSSDDRREVAVAVLRRVLTDVPAELSDDALVRLAEDQFLELDAIESQHAEP